MRRKKNVMLLIYSNEISCQKENTSGSPIYQSYSVLKKEDQIGSYENSVSET